MAIRERSLEENICLMVDMKLKMTANGGMESGTLSNNPEPIYADQACSMVVPSTHQALFSDLVKTHGIQIKLRMPDGRSHKGRFELNVTIADII